MICGDLGKGLLMKASDDFLLNKTFKRTVQSKLEFRVMTDLAHKQTANKQKTRLCLHM